MSRCIQCGKPAPESSKFCESCATSIQQFFKEKQEEEATPERKLSEKIKKKLDQDPNLIVY
ncbi:MAG: hypothetical protein ABH846_02435, partial [Patescibacteria group bacterium]